MVAGAGMQGRVHADLPVSGPVRTIITPRGRVCAVHAGGFRRKGGDSQCVVVLVHKEGREPDSSALGMLDGSGRGSWRTLGVVRHARTQDFGLPLVAALNPIVGCSQCSLGCVLVVWWTACGTRSQH